MSIDLQRRLVLGIDCSTANHSLSFIDHDTIAFLSGATIVTQNVQTREQRFMEDESRRSKPITLLSSSSSDTLVLVEECSDDKSYATVVVYNSKSLEKMHEVGLALSTDDERQQHGSIIAGSYTLSSRNNEMILFGIVDISENVQRLMSWNATDGTLLASIEEAFGYLDGEAQITLHPKDLLLCISEKRNYWVYSFIQEGDDSCKLEVVNFSSKDDLICRLTCHCWINSPANNSSIAFGTNDNKILITDTGSIISEIGMDDSNISCIVSDMNGGFIAGSSTGKVYVYHPTEDTRTFKCTKTLSIKECLMLTTDVHISSITLSPNLDTICVGVSGFNQIYDFNIKSIVNCHHSSRSFIAGHMGKVNGIDTCVQRFSLLTVGSDYTMRLWDLEGGTELVCKKFQDEPLGVSFHPSGLHAIIRFADELRCVNILYDDVRIVWQYTVKMCRVCEFSCGGDRFVVANGNNIVIFSFYSGKRLLTFEGHNSKITELAWGRNDRDIISIDEDGSIYCWDTVTGNRLSSTCKQPIQSTMHPSFCSDKDNNVWILNGNKIELFSRETLESKKVLSNDGEDIGPIVLLSLDDSSLICIGTSDGIKFYSTDDGQEDRSMIIGKNLTTMMIAHDHSLLILVYASGSIVLMELLQQKKPNDSMMSTSTASSDECKRNDCCRDSLVTEMFIEEKDTMIQDLKTTITDLQSNHQYQVSSKQLVYDEERKKLEEENQQIIDKKDARVKDLENEISQLTNHKDSKVLNLNDECQEQINHLLDSQRKKMRQLITLHQEKMHKLGTDVENMESERTAMIKTKESHFNDTKKELKDKIHSEEVKANELEASIRHLRRELDETEAQIEEEIDVLIESTKSKHRKMLVEQQQLTLKFLGENGIMQKRISSIQHDIEQLKEDTKASLLRQDDIRMSISSLEESNQVLESSKIMKDDSLSSKKAIIESLKSKQNELSKYEYVLDEKIEELKKVIPPIDTNIGAALDKNETKERALDDYGVRKKKIEESIEATKTEIARKQREVAFQREKFTHLERTLSWLISEVKECMNYIQRPDDLRSKLNTICREQTKGDSKCNNDNKNNDHPTSHEHAEEEIELNKTLLQLQSKQKRHISRQREEKNSLLQQNRGLLQQIKDESNLIKKMKSSIDSR